MAKVAFLGLGVMGYPMAGHLLKKGGHAVTVYNRTRAKAEQWAKEYGGSHAATPREAAQDCDFVMMCVGNDDDVRSVVYGDSGALAGMKPGAIFVARLDQGRYEVRLANHTEEGGHVQVTALSTEAISCSVTLLLSDKETPGAFGNGITLSPDEKHLYVTAGVRGTMRYDVQPDDTIANGSLFVNHGVDGMKTDERGNLYTTSGGTPGIVQVTSAAGTPLGRFHLPQPSYEPRPRVCATNVAFGDADFHALYITACTHVFKIRLKVAGSRRPA